MIVRPRRGAARRGPGACHRLVTGRRVARRASPGGEADA